MSVFPTGYFNQEENLADRLAGRMNSYQNKKPFRDLSLVSKPKGKLPSE